MATLTAELILDTFSEYFAQRVAHHLRSGSPNPGSLTDSSQPPQDTTQRRHTIPAVPAPTIDDLRAAIVSAATRLGSVPSAIDRLHQATGFKKAGDVPEELFPSAIKALAE